jgi:uncharacterized protein (DUF2141 family)
MRTILLAPLALALAAPALAAGGAPLTIAVAGIGAAKGKVSVLVCREAEFLQPSCAYSGTATATVGTTSVTIADVAPGRYAATAYWDANGNGKADRNLIGMPTELIGFSNDVVVHMSKPKFADAAFSHGATPQKIGFAVRKIP